VNFFAIIETLDLLIALFLITIGIVIQFIPIFEKKITKIIGKTLLSRLMCNRYVQLVAGFFLILTGLRNF
tara:strand:+ start:156 stop:365 length:210 start_codon:yes stop_codon:yes gene_type:complete